MSFTFLLTTLFSFISFFAKLTFYICGSHIGDTAQIGYLHSHPHHDARYYDVCPCRYWFKPG